MSDKKNPKAKKSDADYEVGYGKPPKHTRFPPGHSGNRRGRPKGTKNLKTDLQEELCEKVLVREGDKPRRVSKQRAVVKTLVVRTLKGDARAATLLMSMMMRLADTGEGAPEFAEPLHEDEFEILRTYDERMRRKGAEATSAAVDPDEDTSEDES